MPQIFIMLSPKAQMQLSDKKQTMFFLEELDKIVTAAIASEWRAAADPDLFELTCSVANLIYTRGDADVQVEFRTAAADEYGADSEQFFEDQQTMCERIREAIQPLVKPFCLTYSVWTKSLRDSCFR